MKLLLHNFQQTNRSLLKWNDYLSPAAGGSGQSYQMHITSFAHNLQKSVDDQRLLPTARVHAALQRLVTSKSMLIFCCFIVKFPIVNPC